MNDILARYQQIKAQVRNPWAELEMALAGGKIVLRQGLHRAQYASYGLIVLLAGFIWLLSRFVPERASMGLLGSLAMLALLGALGLLVYIVVSLLMRGLNPPQCILDPDHQELLIYPYRAPKQTVPLQEVSCFVGIFRWSPGGNTGTRWPERRLYIVLQGGKMQELVQRAPSDDLGQRILGYLGDLCEKPVYLTEKGMQTSQFIIDLPASRVFDVQKFVDAQKVFHAANAGVGPTDA